MKPAVNCLLDHSWHLLSSTHLSFMLTGISGSNSQCSEGRINFTLARAPPPSASMASLTFSAKPKLPEFITHSHDRCLISNQQLFPTNWRLFSSEKPSRRLQIARNSHQDYVNQVVASVPILTGLEAIERLRANRIEWNGKQQFLAMYSSVFGGIVTDPAAMLIPMDDHMVHRGHGVFDTAAIIDGHLYELDQHVDRILGSASKAKITAPFDRETIKQILIKTVTVSKCRKGSLRYWLSAGPGDFQLSPSACPQSSLYAVVIQDQSSFDSKGVKVITSSVPIKPPQFATMKSVNYLPNVLSKMEAEENGAYAAIWLDEEGFVAEGPNMNVGFVSKEKELLMPCFDKILSGCTAKRVLKLAEGLVREGKIQGIRVGDVTVEEGKSADEMMLIGSGVLVRAVIQWDDQVIGDGKEGPVTEGLLNAIIEDMNSGPSTVRIPIPY